MSVRTEDGVAAKRAPLLSRPLLLFLGTMIVANIAGRMYRVILPLYVQELGANVEQVGLFFTLGAITPLAFQILGGWLSDAIGRLQAVAIGSLAGVASMALYVVAPSWQWLLISTAAGAMSSSFVAPSFQAFIAEESSEANRGRVYGITEGLFAVVGIIGPPIGGDLSQRLSFRWMFFVATLLYTLAAVVRILMAIRARRRPGAARPKATLAGLKSSLGAMVGLIMAGGVVTWIMVSDGVHDVAHDMAFQLQPLYMQNLMGLSNVEISWLASIASLITMLLMAPSGWIADKKGERVSIVAGSFLSAVGLFAFLQARTFGGFLVAWLFFGMSQGLMRPAYSALISKAVPLRLRGTAFGLFATSMGIVSLPAPYIGGQLWERLGPRVPFYVPLAVTLLMLPVMWVKFKRPAADLVSAGSGEEQPLGEGGGLGSPPGA